MVEILSNLAMFGLNKVRSVLIFSHTKHGKKVKPYEILKFLSIQNKILTNKSVLAKQKIKNCIENCFQYFIRKQMKSQILSYLLFFKKMFGTYS